MSIPTPPKPPPSVPLALIAGFLGAGKTTVLRRLLPLLTQRGLVPHVIINDYRNARIDAQTLEGMATTIAPITGECVCCDSREELLNTLKTIDLPPRSVMLLEANGTADVSELLEILTADRRARRFTLPMSVAVVDAKRWQKRYWHNALEAEQVSVSVGLVLTRSDEVGESRLAQVMLDLDDKAPRGVFMDVIMLADRLADMVDNAEHLPPRRFSPPRLGEEAPHAHHIREHHFASMEMNLPARVSKDRLISFLCELPKEILRVKGVAILDEPAPRAVLFHKIEGSEKPAFADLQQPERFEPVMVLIGPRCPRDVILQAASHYFSAHCISA